MWMRTSGTTERVLDAAIAAGVPRIVCVSTINIFGNTHGKVVDETYRRDPKDGFCSYYDETKWLAQVAAEARIADGAPIVIVQPGVTYGPGDHSSVGQQLHQAYLGTAAFIALGSLGISPVHVDDLAVGILAALGRGHSRAGPMRSAARTSGSRRLWGSRRGRPDMVRRG